MYETIEEIVRRTEIELKAIDKVTNPAYLNGEVVITVMGDYVEDIK